MRYIPSPKGLLRVLLGLIPVFCSAVSGQQTAPPPNYLLSPNDLLEIRVFQEEDLTTIARIAKDGVINFPLLGAVNLRGMSVANATEAIRSRLARDYIVNPQVNITITEYSKRRFTIIGQVQTPGTYDFPNEESIDLLAAVGKAGGYTRIANPAKITLKRTVNGRDVVLKLNAKAMAVDGKFSRFEILPGDTISVPESIF